MNTENSWGDDVTVMVPGTKYEEKKRAVCGGFDALPLPAELAALDAVEEAGLAVEPAEPGGA